MDALGGLSRAMQGRGGGVADDPRVQQALIRETLTALEPGRAARDRRANFATDLDEREQMLHFEDRMADQYEPRRLGRTLDQTQRFGPAMAHAENTIADITGEGAARRTQMPWATTARNSEQEQALERILQQYVRPAELDLERAGVAAAGQANVAGIQQQSGQERDALTALQDIVTSGFGYENTGTEPFMAELQRRLLGGRTDGAGPMGAGGGAPGGAPGVGPVPSNPTVGQRWTFPGGAIGEWDGRGWRQVG